MEDEAKAKNEDADYTYILRSAAYSISGGDFTFTTMLCIISEGMAIFNTYFIS